MLIEEQKYPDINMEHFLLLWEKTECTVPPSVTLDLDEMAHHGFEENISKLFFALVGKCIVLIPGCLVILHLD